MLRRAVTWGARQMYCAPRGAFVGGKAASLPVAAGGLRALRCDEEGGALRMTDMCGRYSAGARGRNHNWAACLRESSSFVLLHLCVGAYGCGVVRAWRLTLHAHVVLAVPRSALVGASPRMIALSAQMQQRAFSAGVENLDLVMRQADSALATVAKAQDLIMSGDFAYPRRPNQPCGPMAPKTRPPLSSCARFSSRAFADTRLLILSRLPLALMLQPSGAMSMLRSWRRWWRALAAAATL